MTKLPKGWHSYDIGCSNSNRPVRCDSCGWEGLENDLDDINDLYERVMPGEIMPAGQCANTVSCSRDGEYRCGALVHYTDIIVAYRLAPNVLEQIVEATE